MTQFEICGAYGRTLHTQTTRSLQESKFKLSHYWDVEDSEAEELFYLDERAQRSLGSKAAVGFDQKALELAVNEARLAQALKHLPEKWKEPIHGPAADGWEEPRRRASAMKKKGAQLPAPRSAIARLARCAGG